MNPWHKWTHGIYKPINWTLLTLFHLLNSQHFVYESFPSQVHLEISESTSSKSHAMMHATASGWKDMARCLLLEMLSWPPVQCDRAGMMMLVNFIWPGALILFFVLPVQWCLIKFRFYFFLLWRQWRRDSPLPVTAWNPSSIGGNCTLAGCYDLWSLNGVLMRWRNNSKTKHDFMK